MPPGAGYSGACSIAAAQKILECIRALPGLKQLRLVKLPVPLPDVKKSPGSERIAQGETGLNGDREKTPAGTCPKLPWQFVGRRLPCRFQV